MTPLNLTHIATMQNFSAVTPFDCKDWCVSQLANACAYQGATPFFIMCLAAIALNTSLFLVPKEKEEIRSALNFFAFAVLMGYILFWFFFL